MRVWRTWSKDLIKRDVKEKLIARRKAENGWIQGRT